MQNRVESYNQLIKNLKKNTQGFKRLNIAVLADFASQHFVKALRSSLIIQQIDATIWEADYNAVDATIFNDTSSLYQQAFDVIVIVPSSFKLGKQFSHSSQKSTFADEQINHVNILVDLLIKRSRAKIIFINFPEPNDGIFGNFANKTTESFLFQIRKLNYELMLLAVRQPDLFIADAQLLYLQKGNAEAFDAKLYIHGDIIYSLDFLGLLAQSISQIIAAVQGNIKKCIIFDLDNTLWGGIIGDDGIENIEIGELGIGKAFTGLQNWLLDLKNRGIILAVCSKNTESIAREVFESHPGMTLRMSDISIFVANWETKVDNIMFIQSVLNIGFDSMVFIDDNPFEREMVQMNIPGITVPDLPEDPAEYVFYLQSLNLFETAIYSGEDTQRTKQYQEEASRLQTQKLFENEDDFLASLRMKALMKPVDVFTCPRVAQLSQRSNQFNLRTVRYSVEDIKRVMQDPGFITLAVSLSDKHGDYGLICAIILKQISQETLFIDTWIMSCRVLKRGVESLVLNEIVSLAKENGFTFIEGEYLETSKNGIVKEHYTHLGFEPMEAPGRFKLNTRTYRERNNFIEKVTTYVEH